MKVNPMKYVVAVVCAMALVGCSPAPDARGSPDPAEVSPAYTTRTYDATYGVACYRFATSSYNLACVKVAP